MAALAPSSPRLPSPPPAAEIQIGPASPSMGSMSTRQAQQMEQTALDANSKRRIHPGTKAADMAAGPPLVPLGELDSAFQLQEHLAALHFHHTGSGTGPINRETAKLLATPPQGIDRTLWLYELCRFLIEQCNGLIVGFLFDTPPCSAATCPEMRASEWQFLCAVHDQPKSCCAIDYCCHTLDWAANIVTNPQIFPSRFVALTDGHDKGSAVKNLVNVFRRLHRIFAHAWFQHRGVFWTVEGQTGLYVFFKTVCDLYDLLPSENYKLPPEAEGLEAPQPAHPAPGSSPTDLYQPQEPLQPQNAQQQAAQQAGPLHPAIVIRPRNGQGTANASDLDLDDDHPNSTNSRTNTRRHIRSSPSTGSAVTTVIEADEDDTVGGDFASRFRGMHIVDPAAAEDDLDAAEVPMIVEHGIPARRMSAIGVTTGPQAAQAFPPIRIATPDHPTTGAAEQHSEEAATPISEGPNTSAKSNEGVDETHDDDGPDVETPVQSEGHSGGETPSASDSDSEQASGDDEAQLKPDSQAVADTAAAAAAPADSGSDPADDEDEAAALQKASGVTSESAEKDQPDAEPSGEGTKSDADSKDSEQREKAESVTDE